MDTRADPVGRPDPGLSHPRLRTNRMGPAGSRTTNLALALRCVARIARPFGPRVHDRRQPVPVGDTWIASTSGKPIPRPLGPVLLPVGIRDPYLMIAGRPYQLTSDYLARVPRKLGEIVHADAHVLVIMGDTTRVIWVSRDGGPLRGYSIDRCMFHE